MSAPVSGRPGGAWAVLIGINLYDEATNHGPLGFCVRDAIALYLLLTDPQRGGFDPACVSLLIDTTPSEIRSLTEAIQTRLLKRHNIQPRQGAIEEILAKRKRPDRAQILWHAHTAADSATPVDLVLVHACCHGQVFDGEVYLVPPEVKPPLYSETAVPLGGIKRMLGDSKACHKVMILDACFSGPALSGSDPTTNEQAGKALLDGDGVHLLASCMPWERAYEDSRNEHGVFTSCVLDGLCGAADRTGQGFVTLNDLYCHVHAEVRDWVRSRAQALPQTPALSGSQARSVVLCRVPSPGGQPNKLTPGINPFIYPNGIREPADFFNRKDELRRLQNLVTKRQNCQIVGPPRIGKSSLLHQVEHLGPAWMPGVVIAYLDHQMPYAGTLVHWLRYAGEQLKWPKQPMDLIDFADGVDAMLRQRIPVVLCLDQFQELVKRPGQFTGDFFMMLRACGQKGLCILTSSAATLADLLGAAHPGSPLFNTFPLLRLGAFSDAQALAFVTLARSGMQSFSVDERAAILGFARGHPMALQIACSSVLEARWDGRSITDAIGRGEDEMKNLLPTWPAFG